MSRVSVTDFLSWSCGPVNIGPDEIDRTGEAWISPIGHRALDVVGLVPGFGEPADLLNDLWYTAEGDYIDAGLSYASAIPIVGYGAAKGAKCVNNAVDAVDVATDTAKAADKTKDAPDAKKGDSGDKKNDSAEKKSEGAEKKKTEDAETPSAPKEEVMIDTGTARARTSADRAVGDQVAAQIGDRGMVMKQTAVNEFQAAVARNTQSGFVGPQETAMIQTLMSKVRVVPDSVSAHIKIFGTADAMGILIFTSDAKVVRAAGIPGVSFSAIVHASVSWIEK